MKGDPCPASLRLCAQLQVRTHLKPAPHELEARNSANNVKECVVEGVLYESITDASRRLGISREAIRNKIKGKPAQRRSSKPIMIGEKKFSSFRAAYQLLGMSPNTLIKWIDEGKAVYL